MNQNITFTPLYATFHHDNKTFSLHSYENNSYYFPSVEAGKFYERNHRMMLPLSITCHHAATDGYHVYCFLDTLQADAAAFEQFL